MKSAGHDTRYGKNPFPCKRLHEFSANGAAPRGGGGVGRGSPGWIGELGRGGGGGGGGGEGGEGGGGGGGPPG
ncbi:hypothetical protein D7Y12_12010, partial [Stenotrophomonas maltophilia]|nr:hypothetical protein [Stenotrophomonas maltophilia]